MNVKGIDVSSYQGLINWADWKNSIGFAMAKATEGYSYTDPYFVHNWAGIKSIGAYRFAYHFGHPDKSPYTQADHFVNTVKSAGLHHGDNFVLDLEAAFGRTPAQVSAWAIEFVHEVKRRAPGHRVLVYTFPFFAEQGNCSSLGDYYLWIANFGVSAPSVPSPWHNWAFWQYIGVNLDRDEFHGDMEKLKHFCTTTGHFAGL